jgi:pSer/pThr/pTyr-binding forkhead associated (FHA) protein
MTTQAPAESIQHPKPYGPVAPPSRPSMPPRGHYLTVDDGPDARSLPLDRDVTHIGRDPKADIRIDDHRVSRDHAVLVQHGRHVRLIDNHSANGTFLNGRQISTANLQHGDVVLVGPVELRYAFYD